MPTYFLTIRAHVADHKYFEDFILFFLQDFKPYCYSIEKDGTPDRHLHCLLQDFKDFSKIQQKFKKQWYTNFKKVLNFHSNSKWIDTKVSLSSCGTGFINYKSVPIDEVDMTIGYIFKDNASRRDSSAIPEEKLLSCIKLYYTHEKLKAKNTIQECEYKILSDRTAPAYILDFCKRTDTRLDDPNLCYLMAQSKLMLYNISDRKLTKMLRELRIGEKQERDDDQETQQFLHNVGEHEFNEDEYLLKDIRLLLNTMKREPALFVKENPKLKQLLWIFKKNKIEPFIMDDILKEKQYLKEIHADEEGMEYE